MNSETTDKTTIVTLTNTSSQLCKEIKEFHTKLEAALEKIENIQEAKRHVTGTTAGRVYQTQTPPAASIRKKTQAMLTMLMNRTRKVELTKKIGTGNEIVAVCL